VFNIEAASHHKDRDVDVSLLKGIFNGLDTTIRMLFDVGTSDDVFVNVDTKVATGGSDIVVEDSPSLASSLVGDRVAAHVTHGRAAGAAARAAAGILDENYEIAIKVTSEDNVTVHVDTNVATGDSILAIARRDSHLLKQASLAAASAAAAAPPSEHLPPLDQAASSNLAVRSQQDAALGYDVHVRVRTHDHVVANVRTNVAASSSSIRE